MTRPINIHPGELLREDFLKPLGITPYRLANDARLSQRRVNQIVNETRVISPETDLHLSAYFGQAPGYWLRVQLAYDLRNAMNSYGARVRATVHPIKAA